eukprot:gene300-389_t
MDYLIVYALLAIIFIIGILSGRNIQNIREYATVSRNWGTTSLLLALLATNVTGASIINGAACVFSSKIILLFALLGGAISFIVIALFIAPRVVYFNHCRTIGDLMKGFYGPYSGILAGALGLLNALLLVGMELHVLGMICEELLGIQATWGIVIGGGALVGYSAYGGIKSVTMADVLKFIMLVVFIPLITLRAVGQIGGSAMLMQQVPEAQFTIFAQQDFSSYLTLFFIRMVPASMVDPAIMQRLLMARTGEQLRNQYLIVSAFDPMFRMVVMLIGLAAVALYPTIRAEQVFPHMIHSLLPVGVQGLAIFGLLTIVMSTINAYVHAAGLILSHDIIHPFYKKKHGAMDELAWARYATLLMGFGAILVGLRANDILWLALDALACTSPLLMFPLLAGLMGLKTSKKDFYIALAVTLSTFIVAKLWFPVSKRHVVLLISMMANGLSFFGAHLMRHGGFVMAEIVKSESALWKPRRKSLMAILRSILPAPRYLITYSQNKVARYGAPYTIFGILCLINLVYFIWAKHAIAYENLVLYFRLIGGILCALLIIHEKWPKRLRPYLPTFWHVTVLYCLPFIHTLSLLFAGGGDAWFMGFSIVIMLLIILLDWMSALLISILGVLLAICCYYVIAPDVIFTGLHTRYSVIYQGIASIVISLLFARKKEVVFDGVVNQRDYFKDIQQENNHSLIETINYREQVLKELDAQEAAMPQDSAAAYFKEAIYRMTDYIRLDVKPISLDDFLGRVDNIAKVQAWEPEPMVQIKNHTSIAEIQADENKLYEVLVNSISYMYKQVNGEEPINVYIDSALLGHSITYIKNYTRKLEALKLTITTKETAPLKKDIYTMDCNKASSWVHEQHVSEELTLLENIRIIDAHYGYLNIELPHTHVYVIPVNLRQIRGQVMELLRQPVEADVEELKHPLAIQLEKELLGRLKGKKVDVSVIHKALDIIKKYHAGVRRKSGEPFFTHPISVALILLDYCQNQDAVIAALLHDTIEDTSLSMSQIQLMFGESVAFIVGKLTNLEDKIRRLKLEEHENIKRLINYEDKRAAYVKLADRLHNMRTISNHPSLVKQKQIANETLLFFVPLAQTLHLMAMAQELEQLSLSVLSHMPLDSLGSYGV